MKRSYLLIVLALLAFTGGCRKEEEIQPLTKTQQEIFNFLPEESQFVVYLNLNELKKTDFWESYFKASLTSYDHDQWLQSFEKETGVGLNTGISQVFISAGNKFDRTGIAVFDKNLNKIKDHFENGNIYIKELVKGRTIYHTKAKFPLYFHFINNSTLLASGSKGYIKSAAAGKKTSLKDNARLMKLIENIKNKNQYWVVTEQGTYAFNYIKNFFELNRSIPVNNIIRSIKGVTLDICFDEGIDIESRLSCSNSKNAYLLSAAIKGALAMDLLTGSDYSLGRILEKTEVETSNSQVNLQLELNENEIKTLKNLAKKRNPEGKL